MTLEKYGIEKGWFEGKPENKMWKLARNAIWEKSLKTVENFFSNTGGTLALYPEFWEKIEIQKLIEGQRALTAPSLLTERNYEPGFQRTIEMIPANEQKWFKARMEDWEKLERDSGSEEREFLTKVRNKVTEYYESLNTSQSRSTIEWSIMRELKRAP